MKAEIALNKIRVQFLVKKALLSNDLSQKTSSIQGFEDAIKLSQDSLGQVRETMESLVAEEESNNKNASEGGTIYGVIDAIINTHDMWVRGDIYVENGEWTEGQRNLHAMIFVPNTQGSLLEPKDYQAIIKRYTARLA